MITIYEDDLRDLLLDLLDGYAKHLYCVLHKLPSCVLG